MNVLRFETKGKKKGIASFVPLELEYEGDEATLKSNGAVVHRIKPDNLVDLYLRIRLSSDFVEDPENERDDESFYEECNSAFGIKLSGIGEDLEPEELELLEFY